MLTKRKSLMDNKVVDALVNWLTRICWIQTTVSSRYVSRTMPLHTTDGLYVTVWPLVGALAPLLVMVLGLGFGWGEWGFDRVYTESIIFLMLAIMIGILSANLGLFFLLGFTFGHFFLATEWMSAPGFGNDGFFYTLLFYRVPLLMVYGLLAMLLIKVPVMTKQLLVQIPPPRSFSEKAKVRMTMAMHALVTLFIVYFWIQIMPVLIRPVYTWLGRQPHVDAIAPLQEYGYWLMIMAVLVSVARIYLQSLTAYRQPLRERLAHIEQEIEEAYTQKATIVPLLDRIHPWLYTVGISVMLALLLSGLYENWLDAIILFAFILVLQAARKRLIPVPLGKWPYWMERFPLVYRLIAGFLIILYLTHVILNELVSGFQQTFRPVIVLTGLAMVIVFLLNPGLPEQKHEKGERTV